MPHLGPEEFERFEKSGPQQDRLAEEDAIASYHLKETGRNILYGPVDKTVPESQALQELALMQVKDLRPEEEIALNALRPTIAGRIFIPDKTVVLDDRGLYSNIKVRGELGIPLPNGGPERMTEVELCYFFAGAVRRIKDHLFGNEPPTRVRTRIFEL